MRTRRVKKRRNAANVSFAEEAIQYVNSCEE